MTERRIHRRCQRALRSLFLDPEQPAPPAAVRRHLDRCPECRALARNLTRADRALGEACGAEADPSPFELRLAWWPLADQLGSGQSPARRRWWPAAAAVGGALAALLLWIGLWSAPRSEPAGPAETPQVADLQARGAAAAPALELVCIPPPGTGAPRPARRAGGCACRLDETLGFSLLNPGGRYRGLALFAQDATGRRLWYLPHPARPGPVAIEPTERPRPLERTVRLAVNHRPGSYRIVALFTDRPIDLETARALAGEGAGREQEETAVHRWQTELTVLEPKP